MQLTKKEAKYVRNFEKTKQSAAKMRLLKKAFISGYVEAIRRLRVELSGVNKSAHIGRLNDVLFIQDLQTDKRDAKVALRDGLKLSADYVKQLKAKRAA